MEILKYLYIKRQMQYLKTNEYSETEDVCIHKETINIFNLLKENQELKKQLEDISEELELVRCDLHNRTSERDGYERELNECLSQQKEFIKFLEDEIKELQKIKETELDYDILKDVIPQLLVCEEIFQNCKSIIGENDV